MPTASRRVAKADRGGCTHQGTEALELMLLYAFAFLQRLYPRVQHSWLPIEGSPREDLHKLRPELLSDEVPSSLVEAPPLPQHTPPDPISHIRVSHQGWAILHTRRDFRPEMAKSLILASRDSRHRSS